MICRSCGFVDPQRVILCYQIFDNQFNMRIFNDEGLDIPYYGFHFPTNHHAKRVTDPFYTLVSLSCLLWILLMNMVRLAWLFLMRCSRTTWLNTMLVTLLEMFLFRFQRMMIWSIFLVVMVRLGSTYGPWGSLNLLLMVEVFWWVFLFILCSCVFNWTCIFFYISHFF